MSFNAPHLLATGLMLLVAFLVGATLGLVLRRLFDALFQRPAKPAVAAVPTAEAVAPAAAAAPEPQLQVQPAEQPEMLDPVVAIDRHVKAPMRPVFAIPDLPPLVPVVETERPALAPARRAGETASGRQLWSPYKPVDPPAPPRPRADGGTATIIPFPVAPPEPPAALVEELEQLMSTPIPVPVALAETAADAGQAIVTAAAEPSSENAEPLPAELPDPQPEAPAAPVFTGIPLSLEAQMASALGAELHLPNAAPAPDETMPVLAAEATPAPRTAAGLSAPAFDLAADTAEPAEAPPAEIVPDVLPEPEPVAPVAEDADEQLVESAFPSEEEVVLTEAVPEPEERIEPEIVEPEAIDASVVAEPAPVPEPVVDPDEAPSPELTEWAEPDAETDEAAAMRAIEGNWTPRRAAAPAARPVEQPEGVEPPAAAAEALAASAAAVASARRMARAVVEEVSPHSARPAGLPAPRDGKPDDLTQIIGILPVVESALNRLGVWHYDQIAAWGADTVNWVETYLGLEGRIGREHWRLQAHELAEARPPQPSTGATDLAKAGE